ncbi:rhodanese-like domain-containing protein 4A, chloroplastic isoform X1 [Vigna radiata var. radiata]|uniref:Rhodanese-like domain-containing protein 4A, chloroplastic isoform X1 n=1 Tax=Vigna radiata var. radiata TaxID=3916 RepID=A0A3Q0EVA6_VIGRR|nr:rhodanese-like domain-containing protein 4A, chloroplastic isoform X1 [Vigna radiata var. radiata]
MDSLSLLLSPYPLSPKPHKPKTFKTFSHFSNQNPQHFTIQPFQSYSSISLSSPQRPSPKALAKPFFSFTLFNLFTQFPCIADVAAEDAGKINIESVLVSIDGFFNRYPFFVGGCAFIWLVAIPLAEEYFKKCKFVSAIDAFRRLRDDPNSQLLDIRDEKSLRFLRSPNLKFIEKEVVQVEFTDGGNEDEFVKKVLGRFKDASNTVLCVLDSFDDNSMKVAELLFKNGFKEAYAIKGGVRGEQGWMAIQDSFLPPSVHIRKRVKSSKEPNKNGNGAIQQKDSNNKSSLSQEISPVGNQKMGNGNVKSSVESTPEVKTGAVVSSSPYPNLQLEISQIHGNSSKFAE